MELMTKSPIQSRMFLWFAKYNNDQIFYEYDQDNNTFNQFNDIKKDILTHFGILGMGMIMQYDITNGMFDVCGRKLSFMFKDNNGNEINLTDTNNVYTDCISYKSAETTLIGRNQGHSFINGYHFGYKVKLKNLNLKIIIHIPLNGKVNMDISLTSDQDMPGDLYVIRNDKTEKVIPLNLIKNQIANANWTIV